jgi:predicted nucleotidyltransferase
MKSFDLTDLQKEQIIATLIPYQPKYIAVFGSYARGDNTDNSDLDLMVDFGINPGIRYFGLSDKISSQIGINVDLVTPQGVSQYILPYIKKDLLVIYGKSER